MMKVDGFRKSIIKNGVDASRRLKGVAVVVVAVALLLGIIVPATYAFSETPSEPCVGEQEVQTPFTSFWENQQGGLMFPTMDSSGNVYFPVENKSGGNSPHYPMTTYSAAAKDPWGASGGSLTLEGSGSISGFVYQEDEVTPIEGATVQVQSWDAEFYQFVGENTTNPSGAYVISGLAAGDYRVLATATGRAYELYYDTCLWTEADPVSVTDGEPTPDIDFSLGPGGNISGRITSADSGTPLSQVSVLASYADFSAVGGWVLSDLSGNYTIASLPYGTYIVRSPSELRFGSGDDNYLMEFWQEKSDWSEADIVTISEGVNPSDIDFTLGIGGTISGRVYQEDGVTPLANVPVGANDYDTNNWMAGTDTDQYGNYTLLLPSGTYRIRASSSWPYVGEYYDGTYYEDEATPVSVTAPNDTLGIDFTLELCGTISGTVEDEYGDPIDGAYVYALDYDGGAWGEGNWTTADGNYTIGALPSGSYRVGAQASGYVTEYYDDVLQWDAATPVPVTAPDYTSGIDFVLEVGGTISGMVEDAIGDPITNLQVHANDYDTNEWMAGTNTDQYGNYTIVGLPTGTYRVRACPSCDELPYVDVCYPDTVSVAAPNDTSGIDFTLEIGGTISGHVYEDDGVTPIGNCHVYADEYDTGSWVEDTHTDQYGNYTIIGLPSGTYGVSTSGAFCHSTMPYADEWYDNTYNEDEATPVHVTAPNDTPPTSTSPSPPS